MSDTFEELTDLQALFRGFGKKWPWALFVYSSFGNDAKQNRAFLRTLPRAISDGDGPTSVAELDDNREDMGFDAPFNVALTYRGLSKLGIEPDILSTFPSEFIQGMAERAEVNHDYGRSAPDSWEQPWRDGSVDIWIGIYGRTEEARDRQRQRLEAHLASHGMQVDGFDLPNQMSADNTPVWIDDPLCQPDAAQAVEHFGFGDGLSNPPIKGISYSGKSDAGGKLDAKGGWHSLAAGEFVYGYLDEIGEVPEGPLSSGIGCNGSYLVLRKLAQDVDAFRSYVSEQAQLNGIGADALATKMVGRTRNADPLVPRRSDDRNDFTYGEDTQGMQCPMGSHLRRTNPRDSLGFQTLLVDRHRILRRGIPYGDLVPRDKTMGEVNPVDSAAGADKPYPAQGLMFLALNVDIRRQFEFVQSQWINYGNDLKQGSDRDPIGGTRHPDNNRMVILSDTEDGIVLCPEIPSFVETRGGDYFFLPGLQAYAAIANDQFS